MAEPSVVGEEAGAQAVVEAELERLGFAVELLEVPESIASDPLAGVPQGSYAGRPVVVGRLSGGEGPTLLVNGHVDVVPAGWPGLWSSPPFAPVRRDGWLHGRGAGDMKCGFAMALLAVEALLRAAPEALAGSLVFVSAIEEECTGNGTLASIRAGVVGDAVLLPEPTGLDLLLGGAGVLWCELTVSGRAGHAHEADAEANPILACLALAAGLRALEDELNRGRPAGEARRVVNVGTIEGGDWRSSAPVGARLGVRVGFPPDWAADAAESAVRAAVLRRDGGPFVAAGPERRRQLRRLPRGRIRARPGPRSRPPPGRRARVRARRRAARASPGDDHGRAPLSQRACAARALLRAARARHPRRGRGRRAGQHRRGRTHPHPLHPGLHGAS